MIRHNDIGRQELQRKIKNQSIRFAGNYGLKIFGLLHCGPGKKMKKATRVFFETETEAILAGFRPCGDCMTPRLSSMKTSSVSIS